MHLPRIAYLEINPYIKISKLIYVKESEE